MFLDTQQAIAGWYPDPSGRLLLRYWDGSAWTLETKGNDNWATPGEITTGTIPVVPETGWAGVAFGLHSALVSGSPATVTITLPTHEVITVDTLNHVYTWANEPALLPDINGSASIVFTPNAVEANLQSRSLDGLLWRISQVAFPTRLAPWLQEDDLYRMQRWPNLTTIQPELDDMRQAAMLANGMFTVDELAGFSDRDTSATRSLINALSLMNTLKVATPRAATVLVPAPGSFGVAQPKLVLQEQPAFVPQKRTAPAQAKPGLFQRLRSRLGL